MCAPVERAGASDGSGEVPVRTVSRVCHAGETVYSGTEQTEILFGPEPVAYVYFFEHAAAFLCPRGERLSRGCSRSPQSLIAQPPAPRPWAAARRGESDAVPCKIERLPLAVGIPATARRIQMLKQRVPCNLVIASRAMTEIRASTGGEEPQCLHVKRQGLMCLFIYFGVLERKANLVGCIAANFVCIRDALNILIS